MEIQSQVLQQSKFKRICVFCGSSQGKKSSYQDAAIELGNELVSRNIDLVYGGGSIGLMGLVSQAVHDGGRHVIGVIPKTLMPRELTGETVGEVKAVAGMHQRKAEMAKHSDAFIALPGGYGTLEELLEVITWAQLGIHDKPVGLLNVDGYYNSLLSFIDKAVEEGFISPSARQIILSAPTAKELVKKLEEYVPCHERVASKMNWEMEQLGYAQPYDISRIPFFSMKSHTHFIFMVTISLLLELESVTLIPRKTLLSLIWLILQREIQLEFQKEDGLLSDSELIIQVLGLCINCHMELHTLWGLNMAFVVKNGKSTEESVLRRIFHPAK
ncbi:hypothetical protein LWI29_030693 [Acer saccharum]|uniref:cytokinin riboside 5'-monophosphate phosphoribohydrolase n=2 Tax=Acer TaxID=4022 RepID=A0AA39S7J1_ACESA|nr:hypothetical protein LWI29_030693 [Acer saccharum]